MGLIAAIIIGIIAGWLSGEIVFGEGFGLLGNLVIGVIGAFVGGLIMEMMGKKSGQSNIVGSILVATLGSVVVLVVANLLF
jgi:uncharacterized membrane protein YeaQ/YmgE (transglycosylase-associated protein family)